MKKRALTILLTFMLLICCALGLTACGNKDNSDPFVLKINEQNVSITEFFYVSLTTNYEGNKTIEWSVENQEIVSVNDGVVTGLSQGSSKIFATVDGKSAETQVTVMPFNEEFLVLRLDTYEVSMEIGDSYTVVPVLKYNGKEINGTFTYQSLAPDNLLIDDNGRITALALGNKSCVVTGEFNGYEKSVAINVNVITNTTLSTSKDAVYIHTYKDIENGYDNEYQLVVTIKENGVDIENPQMTFVAPNGQDVFSVSQSGLITALSAGNSVLTVSYTDSKGALVSKEVAVIVEPVTKEIVDTLNVETSGEYQIDLNDVINSDAQIKSVYTLTENQLKTKVDYAENKLLFDTVVYGDLTLVVETRNVNYNISTHIDWQIYIGQNNLEELKGVAGESVFLTEDLDLVGQSWNSLTDFYGKFDGCGYSIKNLNVADGSGLFKSFNGNIKNLIIENVQLNGNSGALAYSSSTASIENVLVIVSSAVNSAQAGGLFANAEDGNILIKNSIISVAKTVSDQIGFLSGYASGKQEFESVLFIGGSGLINGNKDGFVATLSGDKFIKSDALEAYKDIEDGKIDVSVIDRDEFASKFGITFISNSNINDLNNLAGNENIILTSNLNLSTTTWSNKVNYTGTFDGNGYKIIGLKPKAETGNALFEKFGGTIRNVAFTDVKLNTRTAVIGYGISGHAFVENVSVEISSITYGWADKLYWVGGLFGDLYNNSYSIENITVSIKDVVVSAPTETVNSSGGNAIPFVNEDGENKNNQFGFITGCIKDNALKVENSYFVGGNGRLNGYYDATTKPSSMSGELNTDYFVFATVEDFAIEFDKNKDVWELTELIKTACQNLITPETTKISQENITDLLNLVGNEYVVLTEDLDFSAITSWNTSVAFNGTLDGCGFAIKNFSTNTNLGLFKSVSGVIKNIAFTNVNLAPGASTIAKTMTGNTVIENVLVEVKSKNDGYNPSALIGNVKPSTKSTYTISNVIIVCPETQDNTFGFIGGYGHNVDVSISNGYFVCGNGELFGYKEDNGTELKPTKITGTLNTDYFVYSDLTAFKSNVNSISFSSELSTLYNKIYKV